MSIFNSVKGLRPRKNKFNFTHDHLMSHDMGVIVPCMVWTDLLPGSKAKCSVNQLLRMQAMLAPIMDNLDTYVQFWKVPYRILDPSWEHFISGLEEVDKNFDYDPPFFTYENLNSAIISLTDAEETIEDYLFSGSLLDFLGYPAIDVLPDVHPGSSPSNLPTKELTTRPIQAYLMILRQKYINENLIPDSGDFRDLYDMIVQFSPDTYDYINVVNTFLGDVSNLVASLLIALKKFSPSLCFPHAWGKDYFTSALPFVQVGEPVTLNLAGSAPLSAVVPQNRVVSLISPTNNIHDGVQFHFDGNVNTGDSIVADAGGQSNVPLGTQSRDRIEMIQGKLATDLAVQGTADLSNASAISILELRIANALQSFKELTARIGHRFPEFLKGTWNVNSKDARLQLPEWIGGGKVPVNIADIEQTGATGSGSTPLGQLAGKGTSFGAGFSGFDTYIEEDCLIIGLLFTQPKPRYCQQGFNRHYFKLRDRFDFLHPKFEHIGEQAIQNCELLATGGDGTFGYQARYAEYKSWPSEVHGQFNTSLDFWHLGRKFSELPTLSPEFVYMNQSELTRPFAIQQVQEGSVQALQTWLRYTIEYFAPMSKYGTPMLLN